MTEGFMPVEDEVTPPAPERTQTRSVRRPARGREKSPRTAPKSRTRKPAAPSVPGPAETVRGLLQIPATAVVMIGQRTGSIPLVADGATVLVHGPAFADAMEEWAKVDPRVAVVLEKLVTFGPASAVVTALVIMGAQFYRNHNEESAPLTGGLGAIPATEIITTAGLDIPVMVSNNGQGTANVDSAENAN